MEFIDIEILSIFHMSDYDDGEFDDDLLAGIDLNTIESQFINGGSRSNNFYQSASNGQENQQILNEQPASNAPQRSSETATVKPKKTFVQPIFQSNMPIANQTTKPIIKLIKETRIANLAAEIHIEPISSEITELQSTIKNNVGKDQLMHNHNLNEATKETWVYPTNYSTRAYQFNISKTCLVRNTLVSLPTGLGKTFIAAVVMYNFYRWFPLGKIIFLAPTKPLVAQQIEACYKITGISEVLETNRMIPVK